MVEWVIQIVLQLEVICQFSRHYKQRQCQIFMGYTRIQIFCEEFDRLSENPLISFDQQNICN